jgi:transcriptional regulator with XRE-family HTH domain
MNHWTQESTKDFSYHISLDFFTQLQDRFDESEMLRKALAEQLNLSPGRVSQIFNDPPPNPKLDSLIRYASALGLKVSVVAYDDSDPTNDKGPIFSAIFAKCWERMGKPRDLSALSSADAEEQLINWSGMKKPSARIGKVVQLAQAAAGASMGSLEANSSPSRNMEP